MKNFIAKNFQSMKKKGQNVQYQVRQWVVHLIRICRRLLTLSEQGKQESNRLIDALALVLIIFLKSILLFKMIFFSLKRKKKSNGKDFSWK